MSEQIPNEDNAQVVNVSIFVKNKKRVHTKTKNKRIECQVCLCKMRSDHLKRHMRKHRELHTLDEGEIRDEIKRRKKLLETKDDHEQLIRQIAA